MKLRNRLAAVAAATSIAAAAVAAAPSASAIGYGTVSSNTGGAYVRAQPDPNSAYYAYAYNGYRLTMYCWVDAAWAYGNYWTNRWFQVQVPGWQYGGVGYITASLVANQPPLPHC
jgi:hypothetical protein